MAGGEFVKSRFDLKNFRTLQRQAPAALNGELTRAFKKYLAHLSARLVRERLSGNPLRRRTGELAKWQTQVTGKIGRRQNTLSGTLTNRTPYARIQEHGGVIRPVKGQWLWIPSDALRTRAGVFRGWEQVDWDRVFYRRSSRNRANLVVLEEQDGGIRHVATLAKSIRIPARMGLRKLVRADKPKRIEIFNVAIARATAKAQRGTGGRRR